MPIQGTLLRFTAVITLLLFACHAPVSTTIDSIAARTSDRAKTKLVVFVHGYTGDEDTWTRFMNLVRDDEALQDFETYSFKYTTQMFPGWNNRSIRQIGDLLSTQLTERFEKYKEIYLIGHSMGGLVICSMVIEQLKAGRAQNLHPIKHIILFGTPNNGKQIPEVFKYFDKQLDDLSATEQTVDEIRNEWINRVYSPKISPGDLNYKLAIPVTVVIGLEDDIVDERSARSFFRDPAPVTVPGTHRSMKEPANHDSDAYIIVRNRLLRSQNSGKSYARGEDELIGRSDSMVDLAIGEPFGSKTVITLANSGVQSVVDAAVNLRCFYLMTKEDPHPWLSFEGFPSIQNANSWWIINSIDPGSRFTKDSKESLRRSKIPTLAGLKFTNPDLMAYQFCLRADGGRWDVPFGVDEHFLGALAMGARGAVGSGFNFAAPVYHRLIKAFTAGDLAAAREEQFRGVRLIQLFAGLGYMAAAKAAMRMLGVDVGPARLPNNQLSPEEITRLRADLEAMGFFAWVK